VKSRSRPDGVDEVTSDYTNSVTKAAALSHHLQIVFSTDSLNTTLDTASVANIDVFALSVGGVYSLARPHS